MNAKTTTEADGVGSKALFCEFEKSASISAHRATAEKLQKYAEDRRRWAEERGPIWQKYLAAAIKLEGQARRHQDRAQELLQQNSSGEPRAKRVGSDALFDGPAPDSK